MPWSISTELAFVTAPQVKVVRPPTVMMVCEALNDEMTGAPLHVVDAGVLTGAGAAPSTLILTVTIVPNNPPRGLRNRHVPVCAPGVAGAVIGTSRSAVAPVAVLGIVKARVVVIASPLTNTS